MNAILLCSLVAFLLAVLIDIELLAELVSIGTLFAFSLVCICVIILRFKPDDDGIGLDATDHRELRVTLLVLAFTVGVTLCSAAATTQLEWEYYHPLIYFLLCLPLALIPAALLFWFPGEGFVSYRGLSTADHFKCPLVPLIPLLGIVINIVMITNLRTATFLGFFVWMFAGMAVYLCYGIWHSRLIQENRRLLGAETDDDIVMRILKY